MRLVRKFHAAGPIMRACVGLLTGTASDVAAVRPANEAEGETQ